MNYLAFKEKCPSPAICNRRRSFRFEHRNPWVKSQQAEIRKILGATGAQAKLTIGPANDKYEREADRVTDQVMKISDTDLIHHVKTGSNQPIPVQRKLTGFDREQPDNNAEVTTDFESRIQNLNKGGQSLDPVSRAYFEPRFGRDFSNVRLHTDINAANVAESIRARAFTMGNHIVMGPGEYQPGSLSGRRLLGHELTHVVQQTGKVQRYRKKGSFNFGMADVPPAWVEQPFKSSNKQPWIQKIIITLNAKKSDSGGHDTWLGNLKVIYYKNKVALTDFSIPVSGGSIQVGRTDAGTFTVHRIEGQNYNSGTYSGNLVGGVGPRGRYTPPPGTTANMHLAVFYNRGEAIHVGPVGESSHGCVHVDSSDWGKMRQINYHSVIGRTKIIVKYQKP